jgi:hypothetical protein
MTTISSSTTSTTAYKVTADTTGTLVLQTGATPTTAVTISSAQVVSLTNALDVTSGGTGVTTSTGSGANVLGTSPTLTTPTINSAQVATVSGTAPLYMCRAWVSFNGTGTVAIRASGNVSSITDNGTGDYTVNFTTAMADANFSAVGSSGSGAVGGDDFNLTVNFNQVPTTSSTRVGSSRANNAVFTDTAYISVSIFR